MVDFKKKSLLVIAISARPFAVAAKRAGFQVSVIDGFADADTLEATTQTFVCPFDQQGFIKTPLLNILKQIDLNPFLGCVFGSGFEAQPQLLAEINALLPIIGNAAQVVHDVKNPEYFFSTLIGLQIPYPSIFIELPKKQKNAQYLLKYSGGCGGQHIQYAAENRLIQQGDYYQSFIKGQSISVLFLATKTQNASAHQAHCRASLIGFNAQWVDATASQPFRFGGAASGILISQAIKNKLFEMVEKITQALGLVGLNSLDVILKNEKIYVLEVNPRLSATFDLYAKDWLEDFNLDLMQLHIQACLGESMTSVQERMLKLAHIKTLKTPAQHSNAMKIVYAEKDLSIDENFKWPDWTQDRPLLNQLNSDDLFQNTQDNGLPNNKRIKVLKGMPICSIKTRRTVNKPTLTGKIGVQNQVKLAIVDLNKKVKKLDAAFM